jgi:hypothetical protein
MSRLGLKISTGKNETMTFLGKQAKTMLDGK